MHSRSTRSGRTAVVVAVLAVVVTLVVAAIYWKSRRTPSPTPATVDATPHEITPADQLAREMAAVYFAKDDKAKALETLRPLVEREDADITDLVHAASIYISLADEKSAQALLDRARKIAPNDPAVNYNLGRLARLAPDFEKAIEFLRKAHAAAPGDLPTMLSLGELLEDSAPDEALALYRQVLDAGVDQGGSWYMAAVHRCAMLLRLQDKLEDAEPLLREHAELSARGLRAPSSSQAEVGNFGQIAKPPPRGNRPSGTGVMPTFTDTGTIVLDLAGATSALTADVDGDGRLDLVAWGEHGLSVGLQGEQVFAWRGKQIATDPVDRALAFDLGNDGDLDLLCARGSELALYEAKKDAAANDMSWERSSKTLPALPSAPSDMLVVDYDHEGDLDLLVVGAFGARLFRQDGAGSASGQGGFTDVTKEAGLPMDKPFAWALIEDFDTDQDVDFLLGGEGGLFLASNLRRGHFEDQSARLAAIDALAHEPVVADLDGDGRPDLWSLENGIAALYTNSPSGNLQRAKGGAIVRVQGTQADPAVGVSADQVQALDLDLDGALDVVWPSPESSGSALRGQLALGFPQQMGCEVVSAGAALGSHIEDIDGDLDWDLWWLAADGVHVALGAPPRNHAVRLGFRGNKDNRRGVGAIIELRAGGVYRRIFWPGGIEVAGVGVEQAMDYVRITWPNGVIQYEMRRDLGDRARTKDEYGLFQSEGLVGSCPFLYTWDGARYVFVTDVLGITPLGLPMDAEMFVPPDHDEYVLVKGEQLQPKNGVLEMQVTEELREVTYLDRARLDVVDHPIGTEIFPNERFTFPPFPEPHVHSVRDALAPISAKDDSGKDWSAELAKIDDVYAVPFEPAPSQFLGLATPHHLELAFDREKVAGAKTLRLVMTGWFYWTDASVNMASARDPDQEFVPPLFEVPDGEGGWKSAGPPVGFPAGKTKTMVIDVSGMLVRDDPRIRIFSTLRLYWDSIRLATDGDDAELATRSLEPKSANLWSRGFSRPLDDARPNQPERFDWSEIAAQPRWNQHPGLYTRYGDTVPLLGEVDDRYVILGAGDALTLQFDASALPPVKEGFRRDYLLFLDGWAKDRDLNTAEALYVEPLPFHAMSAYPYRADEHFPNDAAHRAWQREWNTREAHMWIPFLPENDPASRPR